MNPIVKIIKLLASKVGINRAIGYNMVGQAFSVIAGPINMVMIARYFTPDMQGYYYTFNSLLGLQAFLEMGILQSIFQFTAHEYSKLSFSGDGRMGGDLVAK
ncbi:MAG: hypothetical protein ACREKL_02210, partial [Chthoniobacterales bacterium]